MITTLNKTSPERQVKLLAIGLAIFFLIDILRNWELTSLMLSDSENWDFSSLLFFTPKVIFPIGLFGLWMLKRYGWIITTSVITFLTLSIFLTILFEIKWSLNEPSLDLNQTNLGQIEIQPIDKSVIDEIFGVKPISFYVGQLVIIGTILIFINRQFIKDVFKISKRTQLFTLGLISIPVLLHGLFILIG